VAGNRFRIWALRIDSLMPAFERASQLWRAALAQGDPESVEPLRSLVPPGAETDELWWDRSAELGKTIRATYEGIASGTANLLSADFAWGLEESIRDWDAHATRMVEALKQLDPIWCAEWGGPDPRPRRRTALTQWLSWLQGRP
jgi:hypothetical protein